ncbi:hypothetical protein QBZ16_000151 [Prototheca wickerhamii]|uniref:SAP domain-containing protein n=1 Tax=Prototheca wickerhamii TaxID=3111 RepID=A0AAD9MMW3_PROWI|nr:hypothetical protein QBZ16_000151 [Prototheca wickerhamii]
MGSASDDLQNAALGLFDAQLQTRFGLSEVQLQTLRLVGATGAQGAFQNQLAASVGSENRNFFYVIRNLENRGLVTKHPAVVAQPRNNNFFSNHVQTNVIHLTRFAPNDLKFLDPGVKQEALQASDAQGAGHFGTVDDSAQFLAVSERLASLPDCQAIEQELKTALGMSGVRGHRLWRRLRGVLLKRGCIEEFIGQHNSKPVKCIRLLKPWAPEDSGESGDDEDVRGGIQGRQLAEETIDRQILRAILDAGEEGITVSDAHTALGLNLKRNASRLKELQQRYGLTSATTNQGRMLVGRYRAPAALLERYRASQRGLSGVAAPAARLAPATDATPERPGVPESAHADAAPSTQRPCGEMHHARIQWLVEEIARVGFMLVVELGRFLARAESERLGKPLAQPPDRKTCNRVVQRAVESNTLAVLTINMPSKHGTLVNRSQRVVVLPDTAPDEDFVSRVYKHYQSYVHLIRSSKAPNSIASRAARAVGRGGLLPQVQGARFFQPPRRQAAREDEQLLAQNKVSAMQQQIMNGYQVGKMVRASKLHQSILEAAGDAGGPPSLGAEGARLYLVTSVPASVAPSKQRTVTLDASDRSTRIISAATIWNSMKVIGCSAPSDDVLRLAASGKSLAVPLMAAVETEPVRPSEENLYGVASVAYIERAAGPQPEAYDLRSAAGVAAYWSALEDAALEMGAGKRGAPLSAAHLTALANVTTQRCRELAASMDLHIDAVMSFVRQRKARQRADRLQGLNGTAGSEESDSVASLSSSSSSEDEHQLVAGLERGHVPWQGLPPALLFPETDQRKMRWHQEEDKQLLRCWVRFLAVNGPDKPLFWRRIPDRPPGLRAASLRHRLKVLFRSEGTGENMQQLKEIAARTAPGALFRILGLAPTEEEEARAAALIQGVAAAAPGQYKRGATGLPPAGSCASWSRSTRAPAAEEDEEEESGEEEEEEAARQPGAEEEQTALTERAQLARLSRLLLGSEPEVATGPGDKEDAASLIISKDSLGALTGHILAALLQLELDRGLAPLDPDAGKNPPQAPLLSSLLPLLAAVPHAELKAAFGRLVACGAVNPLGAQRQPLRISSTLKKLLLVRCMDDTMDAEPLAMDTGTVAGLQADALPRCWVGHDGKTVLASPASALERKLAILGGCAPALIDSLVDAQVLQLEKAASPQPALTILTACFGHHTAPADSQSAGEQYVVMGPSGVEEWQAGGNRHLSLAQGTSVTVLDQWDGPGQHITVEELKNGASSTLPKLPAELQESLLKSLESPAGEAEAAEVVEAAATTEVPSAAPAEPLAVAAPAKPVAADKPLKLSSKLTKRDLKAMLEKKGLPTTGRKIDLLDRLRKAAKASA